MNIINNMKQLALLLFLGPLLTACGGDNNTSSGNGDTASYRITENGVLCPQADTTEIGGTAISCYWSCAVYKGQKGAVLLHFVKRNNVRWELNDVNTVADPHCDSENS